MASQIYFFQHRFGKGFQMVHLYLPWLLLVGFFANSSSDASTQEAKTDTYGDAEISQVVQITSDFTLICNIRNHPPVIGHNMPVRIRGLESSGAAPDPELHDFLADFLISANRDNKPVILLKNIQRGQQFCLIADIEVNGKDLGDHLVDQGLVKRILKVPLSSASEKETQTAVSPAPAAVQQPASQISKSAASNHAQARGYISSKSSRIFHRADCPHAKRIAEEKKVYFQSREQAASGRRPCKTCNP